MGRKFSFTRYVRYRGNVCLYRHTDAGLCLRPQEGGPAMGLNLSESFLTTRLDDLIGWARKNSLWPMPMGISCCAIEMMSFAGPRYDVARFGSEAFRFSPRQSDLMIVAGTVTYKMSHVVRKIYDQMPDPKWCIAMGACTSSGGMYRSYSVVQGIDLFLPVDIYVAGCPPRPDALIQGLMEIQK